MPERVVLLLVMVLAAVPATAQEKKSAPDASECEPGFERRGYPHGSEQNFRCRTRVIACPEKQGHDADVVMEPSFETARGVQFGYRCEYRSRER